MNNIITLDINDVIYNGPTLTSLDYEPNNIINFDLITLIIYNKYIIEKKEI